MFAVIAVVVILAGWYLLLWSPASSDLDKAKARKTAAEQRQAQVQSEITRLRAAQRNEPQNRAKLETLRTAIPDDPALGQFIIDVNDAATRAGIDFVSISPSLPRAPAVVAAVTPTTLAGSTATTNTTVAGTVVTPAASTAPAEIAVTLQIGGGYFQVLDFLNRLDALPRLVVTDTLNMTADNFGRLTVGISARTFLRAVPAGYGGPATTTTTRPAGAGGTGATTTSTTAAGGAGATTTTAAGGAGTTTTTAGAQP